MAKHKERSCAFQALYSISFAAVESVEELERVYKQARLEQPGMEKAEEQVLCSGFAWELTCGVWKNEAKLNALITRYSHNWRIERIGLLEQILLRLALYEMRKIGTPPRIVMSESMALADDFGATAAKGFINGVLDAAARELDCQI